MRPNLSNFGVVGYALLAMAAIVGNAEFACAQGLAATLPANASAMTYGSGWVFDIG